MLLDHQLDHPKENLPPASILPVTSSIAPARSVSSPWNMHLFGLCTPCILSPGHAISFQFCSTFSHAVPFCPCTLCPSVSTTDTDARCPLSSAIVVLRAPTNLLSLLLTNLLPLLLLHLHERWKLLHEILIHLLIMIAPSLPGCTCRGLIRCASFRRTHCAPKQ